MVSEVLTYLPDRCEKIVDGTLGLGGHALAILKAKDVQSYIGFEKDLKNLKTAKENLKEYKDHLKIFQTGYERITEELEEESVDTVFLDLGICRTQVDDPERGFSFRFESPLDMRFDKSNPKTAELIINTWRREDLQRIFSEYGEERFSGRLANMITKKRPFRTTKELADSIEKMIGRKGKIHPATKVFQALRIEVNDELGALKKGLEGGLGVLKKGGRMIVISYHSLEDRIVKNFFRDEAKDCICPSEQIVCNCDHKASLKIITKKALKPSEEEIGNNPAARSAVMRVVAKRTINNKL